MVPEPSQNGKSGHGENKPGPPKEFQDPVPLKEYRPVTEAQAPTVTEAIPIGRRNALGSSLSDTVEPPSSLSDTSGRSSLSDTVEPPSSLSDTSGRSSLSDTEPRDPIYKAIVKSQPTEGVDSQLALFGLAQRLAGLMPRADEARLKECVARWVGLCVERGIPVSGLTDAWAVFKRKLATVRTPTGEKWNHTVEWSRTVEIPAELAASRNLGPIARVFVALHERTADDDGVFFVGFRKLEEATGINYKTISRCVRKLGELGYVELVKSGDYGLGPGHKANRYRWHHTPIPGGAPWNRGQTPEPDEDLPF